MLLEFKHTSLNTALYYVLSLFLKLLIPCSHCNFFDNPAYLIYIMYFAQVTASCQYKFVFKNAGPFPTKMQPTTIRMHIFFRNKEIPFNRCRTFSSPHNCRTSALIPPLLLLSTHTLSSFRQSQVQLLT